MNAFHERALEFLTPNSDLTEMLRTMFRTGVDHCVMLPSWDSRNYIVFTKDQLVLLIERDSPDIRVADIPKLAAEGGFRPLLFSDRPVLPRDADADPDNLQVLVIEDEQVGLSSMKDALTSREPDFPAWWEAPVPLVLHRRRRTYPNPEAERMFGTALKDLPRDFPENDEFILDLQSGQAARSLMFRRLEDDIFTLEDCTGDATAAADIAWWAALGKAWMVMLDKGKRVYRRCERAEIEEMEEEQLAALEAENTLIPCEWEDDIVGYLCVKKRTVKKKSPGSTETEKAVAAAPAKSRKPPRPAGKRSKTEDRPAEEEETREEIGEETETPEEHGILKTLGPQAMGLLVPGSIPPGELRPSPREKRKPQKAARTGNAGEGNG